MSELMHFGTLRQRWGRRNGPPYPLRGARTYSDAEEFRRIQALKDMAYREVDRRNSKRSDENKIDIYQDANQLPEEVIKAGKKVMNDVWLDVIEKFSVKTLGKQYAPIISGFIKMSTELTTGLFNGFIRENGYPSYLMLKSNRYDSPRIW